MATNAQISLIGYGRVGRALVTANTQQTAAVIKRGDAVPADVQGPVLICTTCDSVPDVYSGLPRSRKTDAVFMSNGMLLRFFAQNQVEDCTQVLLYMSATDEGTLTDGGQTAVTGKWAPEVQHFLLGSGVRCGVLDRGAYTARMLEKLLWSSVLWLVCHVHGGVSVGEALERHREDIVQLVYELYPTAQVYALEAVPEYMEHYMNNPSTVEDVLDSLLSYSETVREAVPSVEMARKEFSWRNGFFIWRQPTRRHAELLEQVGFGDLVAAVADS